MAVLARSSKYGLSQCKSSDKTLCYVKLTDASLKAIEEFSRQRARYGGEKDAQIQFSENEGIIRIPSLQGDSSRGGSSDPQWFKFTVASTASVDGTHCSNDCVQQVKQQSLRSLGPLLYRIRVQAKDDVYETARQRMTSVREESEKNCAKMIKTCPAVGGRNIKVKSGNIRPHPTVPTSSTTSSSTSNTTSSTTSNSSSTTTTNQSRPTTSKDGRRPGFTGRGPGPGPGPTGGPPHGGSDAQKFPSPSGPTRGGFGQSSSVLPSVSSLPNAQRASGGLVNQRHSSPASGTSRRGAVSDVMKRPLRERIVHLLAVRSYKKPELVDRLRRDGLREKDNVTAALVGIAYMKDNTYHLAKHAWSEVNEDWPFYTLQDKQTIKWRKPETLTPPSDSSSSSGHSPGPSSGSTSPPGAGNSANYKRPGYYNEHPDAPPKKVRISHYKRPQAGPDESRIILPPGNPNQGPGSSLISGSGISFGSRGSLNTLPNNHNSRQATNGGGGGAAGGGGNAVSQPGWNSGRNLSMMTESARDELARRTKSTAPPSSTAGRDYNAGEAPNEWRNRGGSNRYESASSSMTSSTNSQPTPESSPDARRHEEPEPPPKKPPAAVTDFSPDEYPKDYVKDFVRIETWDQRNRYKAIFNTEYEEYRKLYSKFNGIAQEFSNLESKLKKCEAGTEARAGARQRIMDSYESHKKAEFVEKRRRLSYLHAKLAHIKQLVLDFHVRNPPGGRTVE